MCIGEALRAGVKVEDAAGKAIRRSVASGHGIGKSAFVSWVILWAQSTVKDARGVVTEKAILYNNLRAWALDNKGKAVSAGGTSGLYSIIALRQVPGETIGLYSPEGFKNGAMFDIAPLNGGYLYKDAKNVAVYGMRLKAYFGWQIANTNTVGAIVNASKDNLPTPAMIDDLLADVRATSASTLLLMHPRMLNHLNEYKADKLQVGVGNKDMDRTFTHWNGIEILTSYNFQDGTEKAATPK